MLAHLWNTVPEHDSLSIPPLNTFLIATVQITDDIKNIDLNLINFEVYNNNFHF